MSLMAARQTRFWLVQERLEAASQWAVVRGLYTDGEPKLADKTGFFLLIEYVVLTRILSLKSGSVKPPGCCGT